MQITVSIDYRRIRNGWPVVCLIALAALFTLLTHEVVVSSAVMSDEYAHLPAGVSYWDLGRFYIYRENPPLVQGLAALPVWLSGAKTDYSRASPRWRSEWDVGADFARANSSHYRRYLMRARSVIVIFAIACGALICHWSGQLYGRSAGLVSAGLWFLDPNVIAFSSVLTTDVGAAGFGCLAAYAFWRFLRNPTWKSAMVAGCALGLAQGSKFSLLALFPAWIALAILAHPSARHPACGASAGRRPFWFQLLIIFGIGLFTLNAFYQFEGTFTPLRAFSFRSRALGAQSTLNLGAPAHGNRFSNGLLANFSVPLPSDYVIGLDSQKWEEENAPLNLSGGRLVRGGRWYSPFLTLSRKLPLGTLLLLAASTAVALLDLRRPTLALWTLWLPIVIILGMFCSQTGLNWVLRYHLILFPFLFIAVGRLVQVSGDRRCPLLLILACLIWNASTLLRIHPDYLSYGNELVGGPAGAQKVFLGSNFDWGQDLLRLKRWCDDHPDARPIALSYYGVVDPESIGLPMSPLPARFDRFTTRGVAEPENDGERPFFWGISSNVLNGLPGTIKLQNGSMHPGLVRSPWLRPENAVAQIGYTIYLFRIGSISKPSQVGTTIPIDHLYECVRTHINVDTLVSP
jgi:Dolichyl-phosphate-mannose-protein mannosyltransferase